tara:strand:+ start:577 stop:1284 length:708 start_codon:yes stop_codon:yes gene_type:complete
LKGSKTFLFKKVILILLIPFCISSCSSKSKISEANFDPCKGFSFKCRKGKQRVIIYSSRGEMVLELDSYQAPLTVANFLDLVGKGVYNNTTFHRVIKEPYPFIIQGGDPNSKKKKILNSKIGLGGFVDPQNGKSRLIPLEIKLNIEEKPRYNRLLKNPNEIKKINLKHERGSISMARSEPLNSASSQFYISLKRLPVLDGRYAVFGKIIKGMEVLDLVRKGDKINKVVHIQKSKY